MAWHRIYVDIDYDYDIIILTELLIVDYYLTTVDYRIIDDFTQEFTHGLTSPGQTKNPPGMRQGQDIPRNTTSRLAKV